MATMDGKHMTKDEALAFDLALEALELTWDSGMPHPNILQVGKAITAIKQACSAPVQQSRSDVEPVGQNICIECANADSWGLPDKPACRSCVSNSEWEPLNVSSKNPATPPAAQRPVAKPHKWVGLDGDDQIKEMWLQMNPQSLVNFARAIEAKLKEKNSD